jgi:hypothetical protein
MGDPLSYRDCLGDRDAVDRGKSPHVLGVCRDQPNQSIRRDILADSPGFPANARLLSNAKNVLELSLN